MGLSQFPKTKNVSLALPGILLLIALFSGFLLARFLGGIGMGYLREQSGNVVEAMTTGIQNELQSEQFSAGAMAGSPWILPALLDPSSKNIEHANSVLDRYNANLDFSVCYLLDPRGKAIASSNRNAPDSFVGKNYAFRSYFQEALRGESSFFMAAGATSHERGFYAAHPVKDGQGKIVGVVAIKKNVTAARNVLAGYPNSFYINPDGIVFITGSKEMVLKTLWPLTSERIQAIQSAKQFGRVSFEPVFSQPIQDGEEVRFRGESYQVFRKFFGPTGWSLVLLTSLKSVFYFVALGWIITAFMVGIILILTLWAFRRVKEQELFRESEERFRAAFESSGIGMALVRPDGRWLQVNPSLCRIVGYLEEELLQKTFQEITHPEDLEADLVQVRRLMAGEMTHYSLEKRYFHKDGHIVWVLLTVSLVRNSQGAPLYFVSQIEDITGRRLDEETLQQKIAELERFNKIAVGRELKMIELKAKIKALEEGKK
ncbi:MAG: PAS domain S-box protein [Candidatus Omnitrophica bacterium]|nr:PAS domain S-box protein [Candidatus Omnitrophota bacterium]